MSDPSVLKNTIIFAQHSNEENLSILASVFSTVSSSSKTFASLKDCFKFFPTTFPHILFFELDQKNLKSLADSFSKSKLLTENLRPIPITSDPKILEEFEKLIPFDYSVKEPLESSEVTRVVKNLKKEGKLTSISLKLVENVRATIEGKVAKLNEGTLVIESPFKIFDSQVISLSGDFIDNLDIEHCAFKVSRANENAVVTHDTSVNMVGLSEAKKRKIRTLV